MLPYREMQRYIRHDDQIRIAEGRDSGCFRIGPMRHTDVPEGNRQGISTLCEEDTSVGEGGVFYYLHSFLNKHIIIGAT